MEYETQTGECLTLNRNDCGGLSHLRAAFQVGVSAILKQRWCLATIVFLSFAAFAMLRAPVPGVNEPHYLCKARHFWDSAWCARDPFLQSSDAHYVFYATLGGLTQCCSLAQTAWLGRTAGWLLLAGGWTQLVSRLVAGRWAPLWSAWMFLGLAAIGNFSGEWVIGGIEAKVLSYGFVLWSLAWCISGAWKRAAAAAGLAISFHPVIGIWSLAAGAFALCWPVCLDLVSRGGQVAVGREGHAQNPP